MNCLLLLWDYPPIIIHEEDRRDYYAALERFDTVQSLDPLTEFLKAQTVKTWQARFERAQKRNNNASGDGGAQPSSPDFFAPVLSLSLVCA